MPPPPPSVVFYLVGKLIGTSTKLVRIQEGPMDGRCAVISSQLAENMFRVFCRDWKVSRKNVEDAVPDIEEVGRKKTLSCKGNSYRVL